MSSKRSRRLLAAAFAISLALHLVVARFVTITNDSQSPERVTLSRRTPLRVAKAVVPRPQPKRQQPRVVRRTRSVPHLLVPAIAPGRGKSREAPHIAARAPAPSAQPSVAATPTPGSEKTAAPACSKPDVAAALAASPPPPVLSAAARGDAVSGIAIVLVHLDPGGHVAATSLAQSSGNSELDIAAQQMARAAGYYPKYVSCKAVAGDFTFSVKFFPW